jgi:DNA-binding transcriptional MerR regulator
LELRQKVDGAVDVSGLLFQYLRVETKVRVRNTMSMSPVNSVTNYLQSVLSTTLQGAGLTTKTNASSLQLPSDTSQLSPFVQVMNTLQQLEQSDPTKYQQVTQQIATNLQAAAQIAQSEGNTTAANQLNQLATDFTNASTSGQFPNIQDMAQAMGGHHHHHHHHSSGTSSSSSSSSTVDQLLAAFQTSASQNDSLDPTSIILNTLSSSS